MSVHKTPSGSYRVRWRDETGHMRSKNFDRKVDAEHFNAKIKLKMPQHHFDNDDSLPFCEFIQIWLRDYGQVYKTESSLIRDRQVIRDYLFPKWGQIKLTSISKRHFIELQGFLSSSTELSPKSVNNIMGLAKKIISCAADWDYVKTNPGLGVKPVKLPEQEFKFWTFEERDRFLSWCKVNDPDLYRIVALAVYSGLRRGEVQGLLRDCLDFERKRIVVKRSYCDKTKQIKLYTKGKTIRHVPMNSLVALILKERSLIPLNSQVLPFNYHNLVDDRFKPAQKKAGVSIITFHDLRHTCASHLAMSGVSVFDIKEMLGHSDIQTTMRYMHLAPGHLDGLTDVLLTKTKSLAGKESNEQNQAQL